MVRRFWFVVVLCALAVGPVLGAEAGAEGKEERLSYPKGWGVRVGYMTADDIVRDPLGLPFDTLSARPRMDSSTLVGGFFFIDGYPWLRLEFGASYMPTKVLHVCPGVDPSSTDVNQRSCIAQESSVDTKLYQFEAVFVPHFRLGRSSFDLGVPFGVGWAIASASSRYAPPQMVVSRSGDVELSASAGMTYFLGLRPIWNIGGGKTIFVECRALRLHRLVNLNARTAKVFEYSAGMSFEVGRKKQKAAAPAEAPPAQPK